jgi:hypothetical protein
VTVDLSREVLQWGRDLIVAETSCSAAMSVVPEPSFNGAAT